MSHPKIDLFRALPEPDRQLVLREIRDLRPWDLDRNTLGILQLALDLGTQNLSPAQTWRVLFEAWIPCVAIECTYAPHPMPPEEMVLATLQQGRCTLCQKTWLKARED